MVSGSPLLRPRDADALRAELRRVAEESGMPLTFGGEVHDDTLLLTEFFGARTSGMRGLAVLPSAGLGGATVVARRPMSVADYRRAATITHDYDGPVLQEGIKSILAVPVVVDGRSRAVLYGAYRAAAPIGNRTADLMIASARRLSRELRIRDEVDRRLRLRDAHLAGLSAGGAATEEIREVHAQLRRLAAQPSAPPGVSSPAAGARRAAGPRQIRRIRCRTVPAGARRARAGRTRLLECRSGNTPFAETGDGEELSA
jgi:hypothetical protein